MIRPESILLMRNRIAILEKVSDGFLVPDQLQKDYLLPKIITDLDMELLRAAGIKISHYEYCTDEEQQK